MRDTEPEHFEFAQSSGMEKAEGRLRRFLQAALRLMRHELGLERRDVGEGMAIPPRMRPHERFCLVSALVIVPLFMGLVYVVVARTQLRFLLYPSLAAIGYQLFIYDPRGLVTSLRDAVLGPFLGALIGAVAVTISMPSPLRVMLVTAAAILAIRLFKIMLAPAISVALLTLLAGNNTFLYLLSVTASALALTIVFRLWRRFIYLPIFGDTLLDAKRQATMAGEGKVSS